LPSHYRKQQSSFVRLPAPELLSLCVLKEKVAKEKEHPAAPSPRGPGKAGAHPTRQRPRYRGVYRDQPEHLFRWLRV